MANRTTSEAVRAILVSGKQYDGSTNLDPFVLTANALTDQVNTEATARGVTISAALLERIECFLSAHFYAHADQLYAESRTEGASAVFQGSWGKGLESTQYGQTAMVLDYSGTLRAISQGVKIGLEWLGIPKSEQTEYEDRD